MATKRLIDANEYPCNKCGKDYCYKNCKDFDEWFNNTVDAVEVVHGRWVRKTTDFVYFYACSECGEPVLRSQWGNDFFSNYCPNCGAKMDGDGDA